MYNPFKWHIVQRSDDKRYGVRKLYWFFPFIGFWYKDFLCDDVNIEIIFKNEHWFHDNCFTRYLDIAEKHIPPKIKINYKLTVIKPEEK